MLACFALAGCSRSDVQVDDTPAEVSGPIEMDELPPMLDQVGHPEHGPHGGQLVEIGKEAFHIEIMQDDGAVAMYLLDGSATGAVASEAASLTVSLKHDGEIKSFELAADPQAEDETGKTSRFTSRDPQLDQWLELGAEGAVTLNVNGKSVTGAVSDRQ